MAVDVDSTGETSRDGAVADLEDVAAAAEWVAEEQQEIAREARLLAKARRRGAAWTQLVDGGGVGRLLARLRRSGTLLFANARRLHATAARSLADEGLTTRQIGARFGVSHQRISAIMGRRDD